LSDFVSHSRHKGFICYFKKILGGINFFDISFASSNGSIGSKIGMLIDLPLNS